MQEVHDDNKNQHEVQETQKDNTTLEVVNEETEPTDPQESQGLDSSDGIRQDDHFQTFEGTKDAKESGMSTSLPDLGKHEDHQAAMEDAEVEANEKKEGKEEETTEESLEGQRNDQQGKTLEGLFLCLAKWLLFVFQCFFTESLHTALRFALNTSQPFYVLCQLVEVEMRLMMHAWDMLSEAVESSASHILSPPCKASQNHIDIKHHKTSWMKHQKKKYRRYYKKKKKTLSSIQAYAL